VEPLQEIPLSCPYCGEDITVLADASAGNHDTIEDCEVCCRPINLHIQVSLDGTCTIAPSRE
jgi:hypothetical protein